jgi:hypothetical protein
MKIGERLQRCNADEAKADPPMQAHVRGRHVGSSLALRQWRQRRWHRSMCCRT